MSTAQISRPSRYGTGIYIRPNGSGYVAQVYVNGKRKTLGTFSHPSRARLARQAYLAMLPVAEEARADLTNAAAYPKISHWLTLTAMEGARRAFK